MYSLQFINVSKKYRVGKWIPSIKNIFERFTRHHENQCHWALKEVTFDIKPGESIGIIGPNGAGKTTILKILSKVTEQTAGRVIVNGKLSALIELGAGFHPELSGKENIYLNGTILGMKKADIKKRFDEIVEFAGVGAYLDTPVKRYSSGMYARLGFAIAAHVDPEVLLVDEVLAVGDYAFQIKCHAKMEELRKKGTSLILVSHNMEAIRKVCDRGLVMYRGENIFLGSSSEAVIAYSETIRKAAKETQVQVPTEGGLSERVMTFEAEIEKVVLRNSNKQNSSMINSGDRASVEMHVYFHKLVKNPVFSLTIRKPDGVLIYDTTTRWMQLKTNNFCPGEKCIVNFELDVPLLDGEYELGADIASSDFKYYLDRIERALSFWVLGTKSAKGIVDLKAKVIIKKIPLDYE
jgi:ABC-type polysaccharide/polyol phosphate transport system ATPase subunit